MIRRRLAAYRSAAVWKQTAHLLLGLIMAVGLFSAVATVLPTAVGLSVTLVGIPLLAVSVWGGRGVAAIERLRFRALLGADLPEWAPVEWEAGAAARLKQALSDRPGWKGLAYSMVALPWNVLTFSLTVTLWSLAAGLLSAPLWSQWSEPPPVFHLGTQRVEIAGGWLLACAAAATLLGLVLLLVLPAAIAGLCRADTSIARALLTPNADQHLQQRVSELQGSRDASVASSAAELRRIERDLHDGAQQRLVSVAMTLGLAKERLGEAADPQTKELVGKAHDDAKQAIAELRDLVRGIHPAVLTDRGLDAAVSALAARCPVPVEVRSELGGRRLSPAAEGAAYFVVAEALTNVAKHSAARKATVQLEERDGRLFVDISDDGIGGAAAASTGGLRGMVDRVTAVEGRIRIASPAGGPTTLSVEVPCAS